MFVNPFPFTNGVEAKDADGVSVPVTATDMQGYQSNPFVITDETNLKRELYDLQKMLDPGDPNKTREIWHMFPGAYFFSSDVYLNVPKDCVAYLTTPSSMLAGGCSVVTKIFKPGFKGLIEGQLVVNGGELFLQPGKPVAELVMVKHQAE